MEISYQNIYIRLFLTCLLFAAPLSSWAVDADGDGSDAVEEALAGTSDNDPNERPYWWKTFNGDMEYDQLGGSVSGAGDMNGDGYADFIAGAARGDNNGSQSGYARVYSGIDGSVLYVVNGDSAGDRLGFSVSAAGDINSDGYADIVVGARTGGSYKSGSARVYSGVDGSIFYTVNGDDGSDYLGGSVSGAGDVNGDGYADFVVGATGDDNNGGGPAEESGSARMYSGVNGSVLYTVNGDSDRDELGISVSGVGDVNGDGYSDFVSGAYLDNNNGLDSGSARVYSGINGSVLYTVNGDGEGDNLGISVSGAGDVNNDGYADVVVGAWGDDNNGSASGSARVLSGVDGAILYTFNGDSGDDRLGWAVSGAGDVNGDGYADFIAGAHGNRMARVYSGADGSILYTVKGDVGPGDGFGISVSGAGDVDGDGLSDFIVGAAQDSNNGTYSGSVRVYLSSNLLNDVDLDFIINSADLDDDGDGMPDTWENNYLGLNSLLNDAASDLDGDGAVNLLEYIRGTDPADNQSYDLTVVVNDFDNDGDGDLLFQDSGTGSMVLWGIQDVAKASAVWLGNMTTATVAVIADIDADFDSDILFQNPSDQGVTAWAMESGALSSSVIIGSQSGYTLSSSAGDLDNDKDADLIFEDAGGNLIVWMMQDGVKQSASWLGTWAGQTVAAVGDIDNDGDDDIITQDTSGNVNVIEMQDGAKVAARWVGQWSGRTIVGAGDADNDGDADIFMENAGDVMVIEMQNGLKVTGRWLGTWSGTEVLAIGDIDNDGDVDLIQQNTGTGSVQVVEIQNANKVTGRWLGTFAYDVKGVIDADGDGDVDVAMQDGSGNVALIELENGSKVGGAKWLGVNAGEMKLFP